MAETTTPDRTKPVGEEVDETPPSGHVEEAEEAPAETGENEIAPPAAFSEQEPASEPKEEEAHKSDAEQEEQHEAEAPHADAPEEPAAEEALPPIDEDAIPTPPEEIASPESASDEHGHMVSEEPASPAQEEATGTEAPAAMPPEPPTESRTPDSLLPEQLAALRQPAWQRYSQPTPRPDGRPRIAVVLTSLGLSRAATEAAIMQLPGAVTLSFTPYAKQLETWIALARSRNHEVLLDLPMEPLTYPTDDPGPQALLTGREPNSNLRYLAWIADRGHEYVGLYGYMGGRFVTSERQMRPVLQYMHDKGLLFLDNGRNSASLVPQISQELGLPYAVNQRAIDEAQLSRVAIDARLAQVERIALKNGYAIATGRPFPVTLERLAAWMADLDERGFQLVPLTAVVTNAAGNQPTAENGGHNPS